MLLSWFLVGVLAFVTTYLATPLITRYSKNFGLSVIDYHKPKNWPLVPISGGLAVLAGVFVGLMAYIFLQTFILEGDKVSSYYLLAAMSSMLMIVFTGFIDDLRVEGKKESSGLKMWQKPLLTLPAALPLMVINSGVSYMHIPFIGSVEFGLLYPLLFIPVGVVGAANMVNNLEGLNGLGPSLALVYLGSLGAYAWVHGSTLASVIALVAFCAVLGFIRFNWCPAKILVGDSFPYLMGSIIAAIAILGNMEKAALVISGPFFIEYFLKLRGGLKKKTIGFLNSRGKVQSRYRKIYSIPHILMRYGKYTEKEVVAFVVVIQLVFVALIWFV